MSSENFPKPFIRLPNTWGVNAVGRLAERISDVHNRLGFDPNRPWNLFSLETFEGKMGDIAKFLSVLGNVISKQAYTDRKVITWTWPLPGDEDSLGSYDAAGILRSIHLPLRTKKPDDLVTLELVDVHSQLLGRIGFEFLRLEELLNVWKVTAKHKQFIGAASMSRNLIEAAAALSAFAESLAKQWSKCKTTSGKIYETSSGGRVDRERALEVYGLRKLLWGSRNELKLHDFENKGLEISLAEWRHPELFDQLLKFNISVRQEASTKPSELPAQLVRVVDKKIILTNTLTSLKKDYELLCNIVHPSIGSFQLFSGRPGTDSTYSFHNIIVGKDRGKPITKAKDPTLSKEISSYGIFSNSISESMFIAGNVYISILELMTAIGDDIALTANIEPLSFLKTWRYPKALRGVECLCTWKQYGGCDHSWGVGGPQVPNSFDVDLRLTRKRGEHR